MGLATIEYRGKNFLIPDSFIELLSQFICEAMERIGIHSFPYNLQQLYEDCDYNRLGQSIGIVDISLDEFVVSELDKTIFIHVLDQTKTLLALMGDELSLAWLNDFESHKSNDALKSPWFIPVKIHSIVNTIDIIQQILNGTWEHENYYLTYAGYPEPTGTEII